jgi:nucleoside transporter
MERLFSLVGMVVILAIAWALSTDRKAIQPRTIGWGLGLQLILALFVLKTPIGQEVFSWVGSKITRVLNLSYVGSDFMFGPLGRQGGGQLDVKVGELTGIAAQGFIFAFQILPTIIFVAAMFAILYHLGVMQVIVRGVAKLMTRLMGASGAESLNVAASIFMGQTEAPLTVRPFLNKMTQSELMCVMTAGMAHVSGSIMAAYIAFGVEAKHLLAAVIMTAPGTILLAKMLVPETGTPETAGTVKLDDQRTDANVIGAAARGTSEGLQLALNVAAMLISFLSLVALVNLLLAKLGGPVRRRSQPADHPGLRLHAARARYGRAVEGRLRDRRPARHAHGAERAHRLREARRAQGDARPAHLHDRHLRALRLRQPELDRDPDRRHRRARSREKAGSGTARPARAAGGHLRQLPDRLHRRGAAVSQAAVSERLRRLDAAADVLRSRTPLQPVMGIILGSGLGAFADSLEDAVSVPYAEIPHFPASTVVGHGGALVVGRCQGVPVAVMKGRVHYYEGYTLEQVVFPRGCWAASVSRRCW